MAFASDAGWTNLPNGKFSPTIFSQKALKTFRKVSVVEDITNTDYFGEIASYGDTVKIIMEPSITVSSYVRGQKPTTQDLVDNDMSITVNQANQFQFALEDIEVKQSHVNFEALASNRAAYELKDAYDKNVLTFMSANAGITSGLGTTTAAIQVKTGVTPSATAFTPLGLLARIKRQMDLANIPTDNRYVVADPYFFEQLGDENSKLLNNDYTDKGILRNGKVTEGLIRGFKLYESNNLPQGGTGPGAAAGAANYGTIIAGHMSAVATVSQIAKTEKFRSPERFADVVRGLHLFGRAVIRPEALATVRYAVG